MDAIVQRAKTSSLTTDNVIIRAMNDDLIEVSDISGCNTLKELYKIDQRAAKEVELANDALLKLTASARSSNRRSVKGFNVDALEDAYEVARIVEQRIRTRASDLNVKYVLECEDEPGARKAAREYKDNNERMDREYKSSYGKESDFKEFKYNSKDFK